MMYKIYLYIYLCKEKNAIKKRLNNVSREQGSSGGGKGASNLDTTYKI